VNSKRFTKLLSLSRTAKLAIGIRLTFSSHDQPSARCTPVRRFADGWPTRSARKSDGRAAY